MRRQVEQEREREARITSRCLANRGQTLEKKDQ